MGRLRAEILHRDLLKEKEGKRGKEQEQRSEQQVSEDRRGDRERRTYIGISSKREREEKKRARAEI